MSENDLYTAEVRTNFGLIQSIFKKSSLLRFENKLEAHTMGDISLETHAEHYTYFPGTLIEQMPILIAQGMTPISAADLMRQRIWALSQPTEVKILWWNNHFHLGDAVLYHPDGKIKIELDSQLLRQLNAQSKLQDGQLGIDSETYLSSRGKEFDGKEISPLGLPLSKTSILAHPLWNYLAREKNC